MPDPAETPQDDASPLSWGILGTGKIARQFAAALVEISGARLAGVASRDPANARSFAEGIGPAPPPPVFESYAALCSAPGIDVVYIATPTASHADLARMALQAGKAVLCEKPFCCSAGEAETVFALAREKDLFVMEAMWMRFNPLIRKVRDLIGDGTIGDVRTMHAELGYAKPPEASGRAEEGRGARLAFGCYGVSLALYLFGAPRSSSLHLVHAPAGSEDTVAVTLGYPETVVSLQASEGATLSNSARLHGTRGTITIEAPFIDTTALHVFSLDRLAERSLADRLKAKLGLGSNALSDPSLRGSGFRGEIEEVNRCLRAGLVESPAMPWAQTLLTHRLLETG